MESLGNEAPIWVDSAQAPGTKQPMFSWAKVVKGKSSNADTIASIVTMKKAACVYASRQNRICPTAVCAKR